MTKSNRLSSALRSSIIALSGIIIMGCAPTTHRSEPLMRTRALVKVPANGVAGELEAAARRHPGRSGFAVLEGNQEAFTSRVALADFASKTLDVQYYIWDTDTIGSILADRIIRAADRGVRVRFLLDDVNFKKRDSAAAAFDAHPNIEVRIFNPHRSRSMRMLEFLGRFDQLNHRMHNKVMVMDNACAIVGGRNIADHYFGLGEDYNYRDLDVAATGPIVRKISATFDEFWNSSDATPISELSGGKATLDDFRSQLATLRSRIDPQRYPFPLDDDVAALRSRIGKLESRLVWARGEVLHDTYQSLHGNDAGGKMNLRIHAEVAKARSHVDIEAAYFVLRDAAIGTARDLVQRGVRVRVLTNALAGNDVIAAQAGHTRRRPEVIGAGVEVHELRPDAASVQSQVAPHARNAKSALHTKALSIDGRTAFVGSFNFDPRSADINSEIGLLVHSEAFASQVEAFLDQGVRPENSYRVTIGSNGRTLWATEVDGHAKTWTHDPETTLSRRMINGLMTLLPIEDQL